MFDFRLLWSDYYSLPSDSLCCGVVHAVLSASSEFALIRASIPKKYEALEGDSMVFEARLGILPAIQ